MLSDARVRAAKAADKPYKLTDGGQLYLLVTVHGTRSWRLNYKFGSNAAGRPAQKTLVIGQYPAMSLKDAREARDRAKALLARGVEPTHANVFPVAKQLETVLTFQEAGLEWYRLQKARWSKVHAADVLASLEADVFPRIGAMPFDQVTARAIMTVLQPIADRGAVETAHRTRQRISGIFVYGVALGLIESDPAASLAVALPRKPKAKAQPAITDMRELRQLLIDCEAERCRPITKFALRLLALTAVRPGELHGARWEEFEGLDGPTPIWRIPSTRMTGDLDRKREAGGDHLVPLAPAAVEVIEAASALTGTGPLIFPCDRHSHRPMSENTIRALLIRAGYYQRHVPHGFRAAFSTIMNERAERQWRSSGHAGISPDRAIIDLMLAHIPQNRVESAYNRAAYMERRRELACEWAEILLQDMWPPLLHLGQPMRWAATGPKRPGSRR
ncbi:MULTISPECIES: tyrosine-type recombinase/integrase [unclassified Sphingobium]|uniref:tyrosine-type recombinase/integrase n=1 Tax=unclassified Sphingobium TaxID=2611147 RepID=UPI0022249A2E|nr:MULTISPECIES: integrase arm-type DNA-binding domain-containing protein [unclassified Sphingobium]